MQCFRDLVAADETIFSSAGLTAGHVRWMGNWAPSLGSSDPYCRIQVPIGHTHNSTGLDSTGVCRWAGSLPRLQSSRTHSTQSGGQQPLLV